MKNSPVFRARQLYETLFLPRRHCADRSAAVDITVKGAAMISVSNVEQLYTEVNKAANTGVMLALAPGTYVLTRLDPNGNPRPNGGRLELQQDMSLIGVTGHPGEVVIDSSDPAGPSFPIPPFGNAGTIRIGRGRESVEWLTVKGGTNSAGGVQTDLVGSLTPSVRIAHVGSTGSVRGIDVRNLASPGRKLSVDLEANDLFANASTANQGGQGMRFVNTSSDRASIVARLRGNTSRSNDAGFLVSNQGSSQASIAIDSHDDRIADNLVGGEIFGGLTTAPATVANDNTIVFTMHGGSISGSHGTVQGFTSGLNVVGGGFTTPLGMPGGSPNSASRNAVQVSISGTLFDGNAQLDVMAWGAKSPSAELAGTNNVVSIDLHGVSLVHSHFDSSDSLPAEPAQTNRAVILK
jgi:hypothetical protein